MGVEINIDGIEKDILKYMKTFSKEYTKEGCNQITKKAKSCIEMFYRDYEPIYYDRTFDLLKNSYVPYYRNNGNTYYGGVRITSDFMSPYYSGGIMNYNHTDPIIIAQLGWHGWHGDPTGYNGKFKPIKTTPPLDVLRDFVNNKSFLDIMYKHADSKASNQKYKYLEIK